MHFYTRLKSSHGSGQRHQQITTGKQTNQDRSSFRFTRPAVSDDLSPRQGGSSRKALILPGTHIGGLKGRLILPWRHGPSISEISRFRGLFVFFNLDIFHHRKAVYTAFHQQLCCCRYAGSWANTDRSWMHCFSYTPLLPWAMINDTRV